MARLLRELLSALTPRKCWRFCNGNGRSKFSAGFECCEGYNTCQSFTLNWPHWSPSLKPLKFLPSPSQKIFFLSIKKLFIILNVSKVIWKASSLRYKLITYQYFFLYCIFVGIVKLFSYLIFIVCVHHVSLHHPHNQIGLSLLEIGFKLFSLLL
jgi:hypothetical protein